LTVVPPIGIETPKWSSEAATKVTVAAIVSPLIAVVSDKRRTMTSSVVQPAAELAAKLAGASAGLLAPVGSLVAVPAGVELNRLLFDLVGNRGGHDTPPAA
jgi:hypothetical protein